MARLDDLGLQFGDTGNSSIEVVDFKPLQYAVAIRLVIRITDRPMVVFDLKAVQLEDQRTPGATPDTGSNRMARGASG